MDLISGAANVAGIAGAAAPLVRRGALEREFHACFARAVRHAFIEQDRDDRGATASLVADSLKPKRAYLLLGQQDEQLAAPDRVERWSRLLREELPLLGVIDEQAVDIARLAQETARSLAREIDRAARQPESVLALPLLLARSASADTGVGVPEETASTFVRASSGALSNIATLPLSEQPVARPEQDSVEALLAEHRLAVISGGPGAGKSVLAEMTARSRSAGEDLELVWWVSAKTPQLLLDACEALLRELGEQPTDDLPAQIRSLLARRRGWFVVVDDAPGFDTLRELLPTAHAGGTVLVTTRSAASFPKHAVVQMDAADDTTLRGIARRRLPDEVSEGEIDDLLGACAGNPLIVSTASGYVSETGTSVASLVALMRSSPSRVLGGRPESAGFVGVLAAVRDGARGGLAWRLLVAVAVSGGNGVPRRLFETAFAEEADAQLRIDDAFRELIGIGVVSVRGALVQSHALTASVVLDLAEQPLRAASADLLMASIRDLVDVPGRSLPPGIAAVVDAVDPQLEAQRASRVVVRILLAERLAEQGSVAGARRQIEAARAVPFVGQSPDAQIVILQSEARVHLLAGESLEAKHAAERVVAEAAAPDDLRAAAHVTIAWAADALGDPAAARRSIAEALRMMPDDEGVQALHEHFFLLDVPAVERVTGFLELAERSSDEMRGHFLTMASRSSIEAGLSAEAVEYARRAVQIDREVGGERSLHVARDLNDLGMALIADGQLEEAAAALRESVEIYREDQESHSHTALPLLHLGRVLSLRAQETQPPDAGLLGQARRTLEEAIALQRAAAPESDDHASMLYASGDVFLLSGDAHRALDSYREAVRIDRAVHGETHREVGVDIARVMQAQLMLGDADGALGSLLTVKAQLPEWERGDPDLAMRLLCMQAGALLALPPERVLQKAELGGVISRIQVLRRAPGLTEEHRSMAREVLSSAAKSPRASTASS